MQIDPPTDTEVGAIDEGLYSRQLYVLATSAVMCCFTTVDRLMNMFFFEATSLAMRL